VNILNGGAHADNKIDFQEFMVMPIGAAPLQRQAALGRRDLSCPENRIEEKAIAPM
jgi:enolase